MISHFRLKFGRFSSESGEGIPATPVTVFVGPNNSGKSRVLFEIGRYCSTGQKDANALILDDISFEGFPADEMNRVIDRFTQKPARNEHLPLGHVVVGSRGNRMQVPLSPLTNSLRAPHSNLSAFCSWFLAHTMLILDGYSRINLVNQQPAGDLQEPPVSSLQVLFQDKARRDEVRRIIHDAFGYHFVIDPTNIGTLRVRLSQRAPRDEMEERGIHADAVNFHSNAQLIDYASDGVKAFTGIITEVVAGDPQVLLIDEPEAFLHPPLASKLGYEISRAALLNDKRIFISTHSPAFVMGCIQSGAPVNIVRLTYRNGAATSRVLPSDRILELMRNPLLRSTGVLEGLFYEFVIVTESDSDRAFYQEINERLLRFKPEWGIPNCLFINAQNKQTVPTIVRPLRQLGIPAVGILDIDVLKDGGCNWTNLLSSANVPDISHNALATLRVAIKQAMDRTARNPKRDGGLSILAGADREGAINLLRELARYGIFVVPGGELESWLPSLQAPGHGPSWLINIFEKMGEDQEMPTFVRPTDGDVWEFLSRIKVWLLDAHRQGIPS